MVNLIHELRIKKERLVPQYLLRMVQAEISFYRECIQYCENVESELLQIGQVEPIPFHGVPGYSLNVDDYEGGDMDNNQSYNSEPQQNIAPPPRPSPMPPSSYPQARGEYPFQAQSGNELSFNQGDILTIVTQQGDWWVARLNGKEGLIPSNYVRILS